MSDYYDSDDGEIDYDFEAMHNEVYNEPVGDFFAGDGDIVHNDVIDLMSDDENYEEEDEVDDIDLDVYAEGNEDYNPWDDGPFADAEMYQEMVPESELMKKADLIYQLFDVVVQRDDEMRDVQERLRQLELSQPYSPLWLENLPSEMQTLIIDNLSDDDMMTLRLVSKATREVVDKHWRPLKARTTTLPYEVPVGPDDSRRAELALQWGLSLHDLVGVPDLSHRLAKEAVAGTFPFSTLLIRDQKRTGSSARPADPSHYASLGREIDSLDRVVGLRIEFEEDATARQGEHMRALLSSMPRKHGTLSSLHIVFSEVGCRDMFDEAVRFHALTSLELDNGNLAALPKSISRLSRLSSLSLSDCNIEQPVACLWSLPTLKTLVIEFSNLMLAPGIPTAFPLASLRLRGYMQDLPDDIGNLQQLTELSLDDFANDTFPDSISGLSRLEQLALIGCPHLVELPEAWLAGLTRLRTFKLRGADMLQSVPDTIGALQRLTLLSISDTPITCLPPSIGQLSSLHILQLHNALVTSLPDTISSLHRLQSMEIVGTPLEELPAGIGGLSSLRTLVLSAAEQGISIPMDFGRLRALERLVFLGPFAHPLPESLADLPRLTSLSFKGCNDVNHIPGTLGRITSLRELRFKDCNMGTLPDAIGDLARLTHLAIHNNFGPDWMPLGNIQVLPAAMWRAVSLRKLHFQNDSVALPTEMTRLTALTELSLVAGELTGDFPPLRCFPRLRRLTIGEFPAYVYDYDMEPMNDFFDGATMITHLELLSPGRQIPDNRWTEDCLRAVGSLQGVKVLDLSKSQLEEDEVLRIIHWARRSMTALEELDISNCKLTELPPGLFDLRSLRKLNVSRNCLREIPSNICDLKNLRELDCSGMEVPPLDEFGAPKTAHLELGVGILGLGRLSRLTLPADASASGRRPSDDNEYTAEVLRILARRGVRINMDSRGNGASADFCI